MASENTELPNQSDIRASRDSTTWAYKNNTHYQWTYQWTHQKTCATETHHGEQQILPAHKASTTTEIALLAAPSSVKAWSRVALTSVQPPWETLNLASSYLILTNIQAG
uniref:Uncharacterized protein n=1 Tax=Arundo donax TaxID=35708 RepID=A0A0A9F1Q3_ARUDO